MTDLAQARQHWAKTDPLLAELAAGVEFEDWDTESNALRALVQSIAHQQVSLAAGKAIFGRIDAATRCDPVALLQVGEEGLRACGLSRPKAGYVLDLAGRVVDGLDLDELGKLSDEDATAQLVAIKGIGPWTAKMHLMFHMGRPNVLPWEDLGIRLAVERFYGVPEPDVAQWLQQEAMDKWAPYCTLASQMLWGARHSA